MTASNKTNLTLKKVGERLKKQRLKAGYSSLEKFALLNNLPISQYQSMENGEDFKIEDLIEVLDVYKIDLDLFFKGM